MCRDGVRSRKWSVCVGVCVFLEETERYSEKSIQSSQPVCSPILQ